MSRVICAGSINMDIVATAERHPAVGETVAGLDLHYFPGGKGANQAVAAARLGATTLMLGCVGDDSSGSELLTFLGEVGVGTSQIRVVPDTPSGTALIVVADSDNTIVVVPGANGAVEPADVLGVAEEGDVLISQFEIPVEVVTQFFVAGRLAGARTILNPAPAKKMPQALLDEVDILVLNETELGFLLDAAPPSAADVPRMAAALRSHAKQQVLVTLGAEGVVHVDDVRAVHIAGRTVAAVDTTGAGDCFVGAVAAALAGGANLDDAIVVANRAASICVTRPGAGPSMPTLDEVQRVAD